LHNFNNKTEETFLRCKKDSLAIVVTLPTNDFPQILQHARRNFHFIYLYSRPGLYIKIYICKISRGDFPSGEMPMVFLTLDSPSGISSATILPQRRDKLRFLAWYMALVARSFTSIVHLKRAFSSASIFKKLIVFSTASNCFQQTSRNDIAEFRLGYVTFNSNFAFRLSQIARIITKVSRLITVRQLCLLRRCLIYQVLIACG